jgi:hypothetical protein
LQTDISEFQRKQARWDERRLARTKRIEELIELQKARADEAKQRAVADQGTPVVPTAAQRLETMQQQARRMALGHPDEKPAAPQLEPVKLETAQPQPLTGEAPPAGDASPTAPAAEPAKDAVSDAVKAQTPGQQETGATPPPGQQQGSPVPQVPASADGAKPDGTTKEASTSLPSPAPSDGPTAPAVAPSDSANAWHPHVVSAGDDDGIPGGKPHRPGPYKPGKGWHPDIVATLPAEGSPGPADGPLGKGAVQPSRSGETAPQTDGATTAADGSTTSKGADAPAGSTAENPAAGPGKTTDSRKEEDKPNRRPPAHGPRPPVVGGAMPPAFSEILATNLGPAEIRKARALGLEPVSPTDLRSLGMSVTRLRVPRGGNAAALRKTLTEQLPMGGFAANETYWIFGAARPGENRRPLGIPGGLPGGRSLNAKAASNGYSSSAAGTDTSSGGAGTSTSISPAADAALSAPAGAEQASPSDGATASVTDGASDPASDAASGAAPESADGETAASESSTTETAPNEVAARGSDDDANPARRAQRTVPEACKGDQCFASSLIKWHSDLRSCSKDIKVGIIDTSFDITHPAFKRLKRSSGEFLNGEAPSAHDWHGTAVLSLLGGDPASNTPGLIPDANFYLATAFKTDEAGNASTDTMRLLQALDWLDALDVRYINMSFSGPRDPLFEKAIQRMAAKGVVFVAAAGNQGPTAPPSYPAAYPQVIAVTAVNRNGENYRHANRGPYVDLSAPGVEIMTALPDNRQGFRTGTSFAAPFVTAIVATRNDLRHAAAMQKRDLLGRLNLQDLGPPGPDPIYGQGLALAPKVCSGAGGTIAHKEGPAQPPPIAVRSATSISW